VLALFMLGNLNCEQSKLTDLHPFALPMSIFTI
jgi:hypothetical protein